MNDKFRELNKALDKEKIFHFDLKTDNKEIIIVRSAYYDLKDFEKAVVLSKLIEFVKNESQKLNL